MDLWQLAIFSTPFTAPASSIPSALTHSQATHVPMAELRDHWEHKPPKWVCSRHWAGSARIDGLMALCPQVGTVSLGDLDPGSSGSWRSLTSPLSVSGCLLHIPSYTFCQCQATRIPFHAGNLPTSRDRNQHGWCMESLQFNDEAGAPHHRELWPGWPSLQGRRQSREGCYLGSSGSSSPNAGPWVPCHRKGRDDYPFLGKHLSDVNWAT